MFTTRHREGTRDAWDDWQWHGMFLSLRVQLQGCWVQPIRQVILALCKSYGLISIFTRSPRFSRTNRLRIFPEMVASTTCLLSSSTRNIVPAKTAMILPSTSMCSSMSSPNIDAITTKKRDPR